MLHKPHEILMKLGYMPILTCPRTQSEISIMQLSKKDIEYIHRGEARALDSHWRLIKHPRHMKASFESLLLRSQSISIGPESFRFLGQEDLLAHLCLHGASHHWEQLSWLLDIKSLIEKNSIDWGCVINRANALNALAALLMAFAWREVLFEKLMPREIKASWEKSWHLKFLIQVDAAYLEKKPWARSVFGRGLARFLLYPNLIDILFEYRTLAFSHYRFILKYHLPFPKLCLVLCYFLEPVIILSRLFKYTGLALVRVFRRLISI